MIPLVGASDAAVLLIAAAAMGLVTGALVSIGVAVRRRRLWAADSPEFGAIDAETRDRINSAAYRGRAVDNPRDAATAVLFTGHQARRLRRLLAVQVALALVFAAMLATTLIAGEDGPVGLGAALTGGMALLAIGTGLVLRRYRRAEAANLKLAARGARG